MNLLSALGGGALIGLAATLLLVFNGRICGVSGILNQAIGPISLVGLWRWFFLIGLFGAGFVVFIFSPHLFQNNTGRNLIELLIGGFLVGLGSGFAGGCTSGHGVCGVARLSPRSLFATTVFILSGMGTVFLFRWWAWAL